MYAHEYLNAITSADINSRNADFGASPELFRVVLPVGRVFRTADTSVQPHPVRLVGGALVRPFFRVELVVGDVFAGVTSVWQRREHA